jgi:hypothetical protein
MNASSTSDSHAPGTPIHGMDELFAKFSKRALLMFLIGDSKGLQAWRLAGLLWDQFPADFPGFAAELVEGSSVRSACWALSEILKDRGGGHDLYWASLRIANEIPYDDPFEPLWRGPQR